MKCEVIIDKNCEEKVVVFAREKTPLIEEIQSLVLQKELIGYAQGEVVKINPNEVFAFLCEGKKVWALLKDKKYELKMRLYAIEESLGDNFVKVNFLVEAS